MISKEIAFPPSRCERKDCYFHARESERCRARVIVLERTSRMCRTYVQYVGEVQDHA